jgi:di/tricarboxylate transporter
MPSQNSANFSEFQKTRGRFSKTTNQKKRKSSFKKNKKSKKRKEKKKRKKRKKRKKNEKLKVGMFNFLFLDLTIFKNDPLVFQKKTTSQKIVFSKTFETHKTKKKEKKEKKEKRKSESWNVQLSFFWIIVFEKRPLVFGISKNLTPF